MLQTRLQSNEARHEEELRSIRQENYVLQAKVRDTILPCASSLFTRTFQINQPSSANADGKTEPLPPKQREVSELEKLIDGYQAENEKRCKEIKQIEQQHKQVQQSMFDENEKLRQELIHTKMLVEQYENSHGGPVRKQPSTIVLTNLTGPEGDSGENQRLKNEITVLKNKLAALQHNGDDDSLRSLEQRRIKDLERQVKELGTCPNVVRSRAMYFQMKSRVEQVSSEHYHYKRSEVLACLEHRLRRFRHSFV